MNAEEEELVVNFLSVLVKVDVKMKNNLINVVLMKVKITWAKESAEMTESAEVREFAL